MNNDKLEKIVNGYETENEVDVFKVQDGKYLIYQFNSTSQSYKEFPKEQFVDQLLNWMMLDLKELKLKEKLDQTDHSEEILKFQKDIALLKESY